jgi:putative hemolysin
MWAEGWSVAAMVRAVVVLLPASALVSVLSALLERSGPIRLRHWAEEAGGRLRALHDDRLRFGAFRSLLSLGGRLLPIAAYTAMAALLALLGMPHPLLSALAVSAVMLAAIEIVNRALVVHDRERALRALTWLYGVALVLLTPFVAATAALVPRGRLERREEAEEEAAASVEEIEAFIDVGTREGIIEPEQGEWLSNIVDFGESQARSVMTPRIDMVCAPIDASLDALAERFLESGHSRLPLYQESIDHVVAVLHIRDLLRALRTPAAGGAAATARALGAALKPPFFIPETRPLAELLKDLQSRSQQMAIVVDEYGGTSGLVTVEDLVEEIVGEISDEHEDGAAVEAVDLGAGVWQLDGRAHLEVLDELFGVEMDDSEYETVAGLVFNTLGRVAKPDEEVEVGGLRFTVEEVAHRAITRLRVERAAEATAAAAADEEARA